MWLGDERIVPPDDACSNERMVRAALLDPLPGGAAARARARWRRELGPDDAAAAYEGRLRADARQPPAPGPRRCSGSAPTRTPPRSSRASPRCSEHHRLAVGVPEPGMEPPVPRVTLTFPVLNAAREVVFLVAGEDKAEGRARAFGEPPDADRARPPTCARAPGR